MIDGATLGRKTHDQRTLAFTAATFLGAAFLGAGAFFFPKEKVISILKAATGAMRRAAVTSFMVVSFFFKCQGDVV
jgi:hypothetical protein